ncbi:MAG: DUF423 domain-containing protein [Anaerolineae bacterium]
MDRWFVIVGALLAMVAVAAGAFGAHGLAAYFEVHPDLAATFDTAVRYQMTHALALLAISWALTRWQSRLLGWAGALMIAGVVLFSGSLYGISLFGVRWLGAVAPLGGTALIGGWACLALGVWRGRRIE